jgi:long-subunit acyl-CoA synthetase (AMP-forming)
MIAFIVPNVKALKELAQQLGNRSEKLEDLCRDEKILENGNTDKSEALL